jgi:hypothetical protein
MATQVQNGGKATIADRLQNTPTRNAPRFVAMGTGSGQAVTANVLATPVESRVQGTESIITGTVTNDTYQVVATVSATASRAITESGLFDASTAGNMFSYGDFSVINLSNGDSIQFTWQIRIA